MNNTILIVGHFGGDKIFHDGQTIKTKLLFEELSQDSDLKVESVDTYYTRNARIRFVFDLFKRLSHNKTIILLLSENGMRFMFPLFYLISKLTSKKIYHDVIGGNLDEIARIHHGFVKYLKSFDENWVETELLKRKLALLGVDNCRVIPNFKRLDIKCSQYDRTINDPIRFCIFSRVTEKKGINIAIDAINKINNKKPGTCMLDIYGPIDESFKDSFFTQLDNSENVNYKGVVDYSISTEVLSHYYALLFPTYWEGEGFPGTVIDAFSSGLPVIASNWNSNSEFIKNKYTGLIFGNSIDELEKAIEWSIDNPIEINYMKSNCIKEAEKYLPDNHISLIKDIIVHD